MTDAEESERYEAWEAECPVCFGMGRVYHLTDAVECLVCRCNPGQIMGMVRIREEG